MCGSRSREARGNVFIPFHFREASANLLTIDAIDPVGKIPEFKFCAVAVEPAWPERAGMTEGRADGPARPAPRHGPAGSPGPA